MISIGQLRAQLNLVEQEPGDDLELDALAQAYREDPKHWMLDGLDNDSRLLVELSRSVEDYVKGYIGVEDLDEAFPGGLPGDLVQAALLLASHFYENRETTIAGVTLQQVQPGAFELMARYRNWCFG